MPDSSSLAWMRTFEPTAIGVSASNSTPDAPTLSTWPLIVLPLPASVSHESLAQHRIGIRSEALASDFVISSAPSSSCCRLVLQVRLIVDPIRIGLATPSSQLNCRFEPANASIGQSPED
jgi:hypothetical protein